MPRHTRATRYEALMTKAATGDHRAARALLLGEWWPGDPDSAIDRERVIRQARDVAERDAARATTTERDPR